MNCKLILLIILNITIHKINAQIPKTKKITEIVYQYHYNNRIPTSLDTSITLLDTAGYEIVKNPSVHITNVRWFIKETVLSSSKEFKHTRNLFSDSSFHDVFQYIYKDSSIAFTVLNRDTIFKVTKYYKGKKLKRTVTERFPKGYYWADYEEEIIFKNNLFIKRTLETTSKIVDTNFIKKVTYNKICKTRKIYKFNNYRNEWFVAEKFKKGKYEIERFYHDYHKMYFSKKTKFKYNKYGNRISEVTREYPGRYLEKKIIRLYEYY